MFRPFVVNLLSILFFLSPVTSQADTSFLAGMGMTSYTSGRQILSAHAGVDFSHIGVDASSMGYRSKYDYHSAYTLAVFYRFDVGIFWGGAVEGGVGVGGAYSRRGYRAQLDGETVSKSDEAIGPAIRLVYYPIQNLFIKIETLYGAGSTNNLLLVFQDISQISFGVRL